MLRSWRSPTPRAVVLVLVCACGLATARTAGGADAEPKDPDALFREGKRLLNKRDYARACPYLEASFKLDPGTGVLLALAICHEGDGKLASAFAAYGEVTKRALADGRPDRAKVARERAAAIEPKLSTLAISIPRAPSRGAGFTISRNGVVVETEAPVALDGGRYMIEAKADGKQTWTATVTLASAGDRQVVAVPVLEDVPVAPRAAAGPAAARNDTAPVVTTVARSTTPEAAPPSGGGQRGFAVASVALGAVSLVGFGAAGYYGWRAKQKNEASTTGCDGDVCDPGGGANRRAALAAGDTATMAFVAATVTAAAAITMWVIDSKTRPRRGDQSATVRGGVAFDPAGARFMLGLSFSR